MITGSWYGGAFIGAFAGFMFTGAAIKSAKDGKAIYEKTYKAREAEQDDDAPTS